MKLSKRSRVGLVSVLAVLVLIVGGTFVVQQLFPNEKPVVTAAQMQENKHIALSLYAHTQQGLKLTQSIIESEKNQIVKDAAIKMQADLKSTNSALETWFRDHSIVPAQSWVIEKTLQISHHELVEAATSTGRASFALKHFADLAKDLNMPKYTQDEVLIQISKDIQDQSASINVNLGIVE